MKNFIYTNYGLKIDKIYVKNDEKYFFYNNVKIYIIENIKNINELDELFKLTNTLYYNKVPVNTFILNNDSKYYSTRNDNNICLMKVNNIEKDVSYDYIIKFQNINSNLKDYDILSEWKNKVDMLEKEIIEYNKEYPKVQNSINYYIGMAENAIELLSLYKNEIQKNNNSIGHITKFNECKLDNPFTFIKTNRMYDMANYIKYNFLNNTINYDEVDKIFKNVNNEYEVVFLFSNLLFPNIYFDLVEKILTEKENENKIEIFIEKIKSYERLLFYCQNLVKNVNIIKLIIWISE